MCKRDFGVIWQMQFATGLRSNITASELHFEVA
jgi:hypothetical protein